MLGAAQSVALEIENQAQGLTNLTEPKYHNRLHFADALTSMSVQLSILVELEKNESRLDGLRIAGLHCTRFCASWQSEFG